MTANGSRIPGRRFRRSAIKELKIKAFVSELSVGSYEAPELNSAEGAGTARSPPSSTCQEGIRYDPQVISDREDPPSN